MSLAILSAFAAALFAPWVYRCNGRVSGWLLAAVPFGLAIYFAVFIALSLPVTFLVLLSLVPEFRDSGFLFFSTD